MSSSDFVGAVQKWIGEGLDETIRNALLLELDRQSIGGVTRRALDGFTGTRALKESIQDLRSQSCKISRFRLNRIRVLTSC